MFLCAPIAFFLAFVSAAQGRSAPRSRCEPCPYGLIIPICGSNGYLYKDECHMREASCWLEEEITEAPWGGCTQETCSRICTKESMPVCGEDGKIYHGNRCTFLRQSCGRATPLNEAPMTTCTGHADLWIPAWQSNSDEEKAWLDKLL